MIDVLNQLIDALREELQQYGEMLALLDQQQEHVVARRGGDILQTVAAINAQSAVIQNARDAREKKQADLALALGQSAAAPFNSIITLLPQDYRPLISALVAENNELLTRVQQRARQNHLLLSRSLELMQRFISTLLPSSCTTLYRGDGNMFSTPVAGRSLYEAVG